MQTTMAHEIALYVLAFIGFLVINNAIWKRIWKAYFSLKGEAEERNKRVEFAAAIASVFAVIVTIIGLGYSAYKIDALEDRVLKLESARAEPPKEP